jgi:peroxiredoxin Q/BCP
VIGEGEQAPEFSGAANDGTRVSLADWRGQRHVVLFFYARDFTPG